jgi:hypothetical protein
MKKPYFSKSQVSAYPKILRSFAQNMCYRLLIAMFVLRCDVLSAQVSGFSEGKSFSELKAAVYGKSAPQFGKSVRFNPDKIVHSTKTQRQTSLVFLPNWSAEDLPFFCKIEHKWAKKARIPLKFRLGSVEYVDWLEGKSP